MGVRAEPLRARDPILLCMLEGFPHELSHLPHVAKDECWIINSRGIARCYLTYLVRLLFGLHRMPGFGERCFNPPLDRKIVDFFEKLRPDDVERSLRDLYRLYKYTQKCLQSGKILPKEYSSRHSVRLTRGISADYALYVAILKKQALKQGKGYFEVQTDTISSYDFSEKTYTEGVVIKRDVPFEDVLLCDLTVALSGHKDDPCRSDTEWLVINRDPKGLLRLSVEEVIIEDNYYGMLIQEKVERLSKHLPLFEECRYVDLSDMPKVDDPPLVEYARKLDYWIRKFRKWFAG